MAIVLGIDKPSIEKMIGFSDAILFWNELPMALRQYIGTDSYTFENSTEVYLCYGNKIELTAQISAIYNLHYMDRAAYGLNVITSREKCLDMVYRLWCSNNNFVYDSNWIENVKFNEYLKEIGFFSHNYGVQLKNITKYKC